MGIVKIMSYNKLRDRKTQESIFGTVFKVDAYMCCVFGWDNIFVKINGESKPVAVIGENTSRTYGTIVSIPEEYIERVDEYKGKEYKRIPIKTTLGIDCQIYVKR